MSITVRPANLSDLPSIVPLLLQDAAERIDANPGLWHLAPTAEEKVRTTLSTVMTAEDRPFRQQWLIAETESEIMGLTHSILLPVPPIYAGESGPPGLIMEDCYVTPTAPPETRQLLLKAAEADLQQAGAQILLASSVTGGTWERTFDKNGYAPLTVYLAKTGLSQAGTDPTVAAATEADVPDIVTSSAIHRRILDDLHPRFWKPHVEADARFGAWMRRSLTLTDRDLFVSKNDNGFGGYAISQPATPLHFPTPHDISGVGVIDDFHHSALAAADTLGKDRDQAEALFQAAEAARLQRGNHSIIVVCPAAWLSKIELVNSLGYHNGITWHIKIPG